MSRSTLMFPVIVQPIYSHLADVKLLLAVPTTQFLYSVSLLETNIFQFLTIHYSEREKKCFTTRAIKPESSHYDS